MSDEDDKPDDDEEDPEYEYELIMETAHRLEDLAMALCHYNDTFAKRALAIATGTLLGHFEEAPCIHELAEITEAQMDMVVQHHLQNNPKNDDDAGNN
jgi:hypothetical protein